MIATPDRSRIRQPDNEGLHLAPSPDGEIRASAKIQTLIGSLALVVGHVIAVSISAPHKTEAAENVGN